MRRVPASSFTVGSFAPLEIGDALASTEPGCTGQGRKSSPFRSAGEHLARGGAILMAFGGLISLSDRRLRVGAPNRRAKAARPVAMEPAE